MNTPRCKQGDLAVITQGLDAGFLVHVDREHIDGERFSGRQWMTNTGAGKTWVISSLGSPFTVLTVDGAIDQKKHRVRALADGLLRPIRDDEGVDEAFQSRAKQAAGEVTR